jgi:hypothetical protein
MPPKKRGFSSAAAPNKRQKVASRGTASQAIVLDTQQSFLRLSPRKALFTTSQALKFESQLRESHAEDAIVAPAEGSEAATAAKGAVDEGFDTHLEDDFEGIDWTRLPQYMKPLASVRTRRSWIYRYGWRVALIKDPDRIFFVCRYCHEHKIINCGGGGIYGTTKAPSSAARHLEEKRRGHSYTAPNKATVVAQESALERALKDGKLRVSQAVANELSGFNTQRFRHAAVGWLVENNHPLSEFKSLAFRRLTAMASPEAEAALWTSHTSVSRYILRLYDYLKPRVVQELSQALSKIHISFDGWATKGGKRGFLGVVAHYVDSRGDLQDLPIALPQLTGAHSGERMAEVVSQTLRQFNINSCTVGYFMLDNASNNDSV